MGKGSKAISFYSKALEIMEKILPIIISKALNIDDKKLPPDHPDLTSTYGSAGNAYAEIQEYSKVIELSEK
ncbi:unnamed protein product [Rotaria socialis]|uniref:Uncharacterized protein n=1 Tax=Rotaria socialis TaxID=392032 RepID=A0A817W776_9BILA|nr:unnamed protein product [Rotaria socialis]CAF3352097.1 unnamed protein product [Rotaria socialis]CAF4415070.1 unnamed protein product [Rotaria socialis]CAF4492709.1 unnamed protein product [Rotaria socialis]CAF4555542.1 unnamed protein product [Rotaria socialis]